MNERSFGARLTPEARRSACGRRRRSGSICYWKNPIRCGAAKTAGFRRCIRRKAGAALQIPDRRRIDVPDPASRLSARGRLRPERGDRSRELPVARPGLARTPVAGNRPDRNPCRHLHGRGHLPRHDRQARHLRRSGRHGDRNRCPLRIFPVPATGAMTACAGTRPTSSTAGPTISRR